MAITLEDVRARAMPWAEPVSAEAPAGGPARLDPRYERTLAEVAKLESPSGDAVDWKQVVDNSGDLLRTTSKDLLLATHLAFGLYSLHGLDGLTTGIALLSELIEKYWPEMQPDLKRLRGRVNAVAWFVDRTSAGLDGCEVDAADRDAVDGLAMAVGRFADVVRERFGADAPAMTRLVDAALRLERSLQNGEGSVPPSAASTPGTAGAAPVAMPPPSVAANPPSLAPGADTVAYLREFGSALAAGASSLRRGHPADPGTYRALRTGVWLHLAAPPPAVGIVTQVPPPPEALRATFARLAANAKWTELLDESESCLVQHRLWLDPHRISAQALGALGPAYAAARQALIAELAAFLRRMSGMVELCFGNGAPFADVDTRTWVDVEVLPAAGGATRAPAGPDESETFADARKLVGEGKTADAVALLQGRAMSAPTAALAFRTRLELARILLESEQPLLARAIFSGLDEELRTRGLEAWDPSLAAASLEGYVRCLRALTRAGKNVPEDTVVLYSRLCRLDPIVAMRLGS